VHQVLLNGQHLRKQSRYVFVRCFPGHIAFVSEMFRQDRPKQSKLHYVMPLTETDKAFLFNLDLCLGSAKIGQSGFPAYHCVPPFGREFSKA